MLKDVFKEKWMSFLVEILNILNGNLNEYDKNGIVDEAKQLIMYGDMINVYNLKNLDDNNLIKTILHKLFSPDQRECFYLFKHSYDNP